MLYEFDCQSCHGNLTVNRPVEARNDPCPCPKCGEGMTRKVTGGAGFQPVMGAADFPGYMCPVTDQFVDSKKKRREIMARNDLVERG